MNTLGDPVLAVSPICLTAGSGCLASYTTASAAALQAQLGNLPIASATPRPADPNAAASSNVSVAIIAGAAAGAAVLIAIAGIVTFLCFANRRKHSKRKSKEARAASARRKKAKQTVSRADADDDPDEPFSDSSNTVNNALRVAARVALEPETASGTSSLRDMHVAAAAAAAATANRILKAPSTRAAFAGDGKVGLVKAGAAAKAAAGNGNVVRQLGDRSVARSAVANDGYELATNPLHRALPVNSLEAEDADDDDAPRLGGDDVIAEEADTEAVARADALVRSLPSRNSVITSAKSRRDGKSTRRVDANPSAARDALRRALAAFEADNGEAGDGKSAGRDFEELPRVGLNPLLRATAAAALDEAATAASSLPAAAAKRDDRVSVEEAAAISAAAIKSAAAADTLAKSLPSARNVIAKKRVGVVHSARRQSIAAGANAVAGTQVSPRSITEATLSPAERAVAEEMAPPPSSSLHRKDDTAAAARAIDRALSMSLVDTTGDAVTPKRRVVQAKSARTQASSPVAGGASPSAIRTPSRD